MMVDIRTKSTQHGKGISQTTGGAVGGRDIRRAGEGATGNMPSSHKPKLKSAGGVWQVVRMGGWDTSFQGSDAWSVSFRTLIITPDP